MTRSTFSCPECGHEHEEPAVAIYVLAVLCDDCALALILAERREIAERRRHAIPAAA